jgi:putative MFS transporter
VIGPWGLALIVGSSNIITPKASVDALFSAFTYLAGWFVLAGLAYIFIGKETRGRSLEKIEEDLDTLRPEAPASVKVEDQP